MENGQLPPTQTVQSSQGLPMVQQVQAEKPKTTKDNSGLKKTILLKGSLETEHDVLIRSSYSGVGHENCI